MSGKRSRVEQEFMEQDSLVGEVVQARVKKHQNQKDTHKRQMLLAKVDRETENSDFTVQVNTQVSLQLEKTRLEKKLARLQHQQKLAQQLEVENAELAAQNRKLQEEIRKLKPAPLGFTRGGRAFSSDSDHGSQRSISKGSSRSSSGDAVSLVGCVPASARMKAVGLAAASGFPDPLEAAKPKRGRPVKANASEAADEIAKLSVAAVAPST